MMSIRETATDDRWLQHSLCLIAVLVLITLESGGAPKHDDPVTLSFTLRETTVSLHEPVYVDFSVYNELSETISFDLGFDRKQGFQFSITKPNGSTVLLPRYERGGLGRGGEVTLGPGEAYHQPILLSEFYQFTKPGQYWIEVKLTAPIRKRSGHGTSPSNQFKLGLLVAERDAGRLADVCERLVKMATTPYYDETAYNAMLSLSYVQDPVAVTYLARVLNEGNFGVKGMAIEGLARIGNPEAVQVLTSNLNTSDELKAQIEAALWQIKTGVKLQRND